MNNYIAYVSGEGRTFTLQSSQVIHFNVGTQKHTATVKQVGGDYVILTLASTPRDVTIYTGDTGLYDVTGDGHPDISISLLGTRNGSAIVTFAVKPPVVQVSLDTARRSSAFSSADVLIIMLSLIVCGCIIWFALPRKRRG